MKRIALAAVLLVMLAGPAWAGFDEGVAAYERGDYATAIKEFRPLAEQGDALAQYGLGVMYEVGKGVPQDYAEAVKWFRKAAAQGYAKTQYGLGRMYFAGEGDPQKYVEAVKWYRKAAEQGYDEAQLSLGIIYYAGLGVPQNYVQSHMWLNLAAAQGNKGAQIMRDGWAKYLTPADISKAQAMAREWLEKHGE